MGKFGVLLPSAHAQGVKPSLSSRKSADLEFSVRAVLNYHGLIDIGEKLVSVFIELLNMAH